MSTLRTKFLRPRLGSESIGEVEFRWHEKGWDVEITVPESGDVMTWGLARASDDAIDGRLEDTIGRLNRILGGFQSPA